jgi:hypothetical protein
LLHLSASEWWSINFLLVSHGAAKKAKGGRWIFGIKHWIHSRLSGGMSVFLIGITGEAVGNYSQRRVWVCMYVARLTLIDFLLLVAWKNRFHTRVTDFAWILLGFKVATVRLG